MRKDGRVKWKLERKGKEDVEDRMENCDGW